MKFEKYELHNYQQIMNNICLYTYVINIYKK